MSLSTTAFISTLPNSDVSKLENPVDVDSELVSEVDVDIVVQSSGLVRRSVFAVVSSNEGVSGSIK